jgi:hypothetical protein
LFGINLNIPGQATFFVSPNGTNSTGTTAAAGDIIMPAACTFDSLYTLANATSGSGTATVTLYKNDAATNLSCSNTVAVGSNTQCHDPNGATTDAVAVEAGDLVAVRVAWSGSAPFGRLAISLHCR